VYHIWTKFWLMIQKCKAYNSYHILAWFEITISFFKTKHKIWWNLYTFRKFILIKKELTQEMWLIRGLFNIFVTGCKNSFKKSFHFEKMKMFKKGPFAIESFVILWLYPNLHFKRQLLLQKNLGKGWQECKESYIITRLHAKM
jgi:hypothetical protein